MKQISDVDTTTSSSPALGAGVVMDHSVRPRDSPKDELPGLVERVVEVSDPEPHGDEIAAVLLPRLRDLRRFDLDVLHAVDAALAPEPGQIAVERDRHLVAEVGADGRQVPAGPADLKP